MTVSTTPWTASGMTNLNQGLVIDVRNTLELLITQPAAHAQFLNMLSMLEHMGSRKIMLSQNHRTLNQDTLKHLAEEARHAFFFKRQAEKIAGHALPDYSPDNTMRFFAAQQYFGRLDSAIMHHVGMNAAYPWVSLIVELRACWFYGLYQSVLEQSAIKISLKSLLAEEDHHLAEMYESCGENTETLRALCAIETDLFHKFWAGIVEQIDAKIAA